MVSTTLGQSTDSIEKKQELWHQFIMRGGVSELQQLFEYDQQLISRAKWLNTGMLPSTFDPHILRAQRAASTHGRGICLQCITFGGKKPCLVCIVLASILLCY